MIKTISINIAYILFPLFLFIVFVDFAFAQLINPLGNQGITNIQGFICLAVNFMSQVLMPPIAVLLVVYAGFLYLTAVGKPENIKNAHNTLVAVAIGVVVLLLAPALTSLAVSLAGGSVQAGDACSLNVASANITNAFVSLINWFAWLVAVVSVLMGLYSGFLYMTSQGRPENVKKASSVFLYTMLGVAVSLIAFGIISIIEKFIK